MSQTEAERNRWLVKDGKHMEGELTQPTIPTK
jgi:hypothetical protein